MWISKRFYFKVLLLSYAGKVQGSNRQVKWIWGSFGRPLESFWLHLSLASNCKVVLIREWYNYPCVADIPAIISKLQLTSAKHWNWFDNNNNDTTTTTTTTTTNTTNTTITTTTTTNNNNNTKANPRKCHLYCLVLKLFKLYLLGKEKILLFPEMRVTRKIFARAVANLFFLNLFSGNILFSSLVSFVVVFCFFCLFVYFLKLKVYILIHVAYER